MKKKYMRNFDWGLVYGLIGHDIFWIKVSGLKWGLDIQKRPKKFSERQGYTRYLQLPHGWIVSVLKAKI